MTSTRRGRGQVQVDSSRWNIGSVSWGRTHRKLEPTDVVLSSFYAKKLTFSVPIGDVSFQRTYLLDTCIEFCFGATSADAWLQALNSDNGAAEVNKLNLISQLTHEQTWELLQCANPTPLGTKLTPNRLQVDDLPRLGQNATDKYM